MEQHSSSTYKENWYLENIRLSKKRCLPGESITITGRLINKMSSDLNIVKVWVQPGWLLNGKAYPFEIKGLLKPNGSKSIALRVTIPKDLPLGEYTCAFGVEGEFLREPYFSWMHTLKLFEIKHPKRHVKIFFSHSTQNMSLVYQIASYLDNYGYEVIIAEDIQEPGAVLREKFERLIKESRFVIALFTHEGVRSQWVKEEVEYARSLRRIVLPLKESSVSIQSDIEWVSFSKYDPPDVINKTVLDAVVNILKRAGGFPWLAALVVGFVVLSLISEDGDDPE